MLLHQVQNSLTFAEFSAPRILASPIPLLYVYSPQTGPLGPSLTRSTEPASPFKGTQVSDPSHWVCVDRVLAIG